MTLLPWGGSVMSPRSTNLVTKPVTRGMMPPPSWQSNRAEVKQCRQQDVFSHNWSHGARHGQSPADHQMTSVQQDAATHCPPLTLTHALRLADQRMVIENAHKNQFRFGQITGSLRPTGLASGHRLTTVCLSPLVSAAYALWHEIRATCPGLP